MDSDVQGRGGDGVADEPTGKLIHDFVDESKRVLAEGKRLLRSEIDTARDEIKREVKKVGPAAGMAGAGGVLAHVAVLMLAFALAAALSLVMPNWAAFLISGVLLGIAGALSLAGARNKLRSVTLKDGVTVHNLEEDQRWAKGLTQNVRSNLQQDT
jgi:hypothetical protein